MVLNVEIPNLMSVRAIAILVGISFIASKLLMLVHFAANLQELPSERDSPESLRAKLDETRISVPIPSTDGKFGKPAATNESNPFGFAETDETHFW